MREIVFARKKPRNGLPKAEYRIRAKSIVGRAQNRCATYCISPSSVLEWRYHPIILTMLDAVYVRSFAETNRGRGERDLRRRQYGR
ncbi:MAG: hypothetical protein HY675_21870 [Chloroflexi bacterium]|nr:hypothetical protein [Chloroflexota bacterium]